MPTTVWPAQPRREVMAGEGGAASIEGTVGKSPEQPSPRVLAVESPPLLLSAALPQQRNVGILTR